MLSVMQLKSPLRPPYLSALISHHFLQVGLCPTRFLPRRTRGGITRGQQRSRGVDRVDSSPRDQ